MKINQINDLNRKARKYLLCNCVSLRSADVFAIGFSGYINGDHVENVDLIREGGMWKIVSASKELILSLKGKLTGFCMHKHQSQL